jgi:HAD superfamily hydrolase (TIGR01509 family)
MRTPEAIVFDLGKVLVDFDYGIAVQRIAERCNGSSCDLRQLLTPEAKLLVRYESGALTTEGFFDELSALAGYQGDLPEFCQLFADIFWPISPMLNLHERIRARGLPTYIFSNTNPLAVEHIRERFPFFNNFTAYILSYEHGSMKPEEKIYQVVEQVTGKVGEAILYIDDRPENVEAGSQRGWQTILQVSPGETISRAASLRLI